MKFQFRISYNEAMRDLNASPPDGISLLNVSSRVEDVRRFLAEIKREFWEIFKTPADIKNRAPWTAPRLDQETVDPAHADPIRELFMDSVNRWAPQIGARYGRVSIKDQKTRWGSCSQKGNLNFNWRLIHAPEAVRDYVVIHELCHLTQMNHSQKFWQEVSRFCPDYKSHRQWLRENGRTLQTKTQ